MHEGKRHEKGRVHLPGKDACFIVCGPKGPKDLQPILEIACLRVCLRRVDPKPEVGEQVTLSDGSTMTIDFVAPTDLPNDLTLE